MVVYAGQGDARRSLALLWGRQLPMEARPGPKPVLDVQVIVDVAITVADADGMSALSMRTVGERLGKTAMAIYTYVPNKSVLIDLMYDRVLGERLTDHPLDDGWRPALDAWAHDAWEFYGRHPWMLQVSTARPVLGPNEYRGYEELVRILRATELPAVEIRRLAESLTSCVRGLSQAFAETREAAKATGVSEEEWWNVRSALVDQYAPDFAERFPSLAAIERDGAYVPTSETTPYLEQQALEAFQAGLRVLLDGIERAVTQPADRP